MAFPVLDGDTLSGAPYPLGPRGRMTFTPEGIRFRHTGSFLDFWLVRLLVLAGPSVLLFALAPQWIEASAWQAAGRFLMPAVYLVLAAVAISLAPRRSTELRLDPSKVEGVVLDTRDMRVLFQIKSDPARALPWQRSMLIGADFEGDWRPVERHLMRLFGDRYDSYLLEPSPRVAGLVAIGVAVLALVVAALVSAPHLVGT